MLLRMLLYVCQRAQRSAAFYMFAYARYAAVSALICCRCHGARQRHADGATCCCLCAGAMLSVDDAAAQRAIKEASARYEALRGA